MKTNYIELVKKYIRRHYNEEIIEIERLATGLCHYVYNVKSGNGEEVVIRIAREGTESLIRSGVYWNEYLKGLDLPLAKLLHYNLNEKLPYMVVAKLPGKDLCYVYDELTGEQKQVLAREIVSIQSLVSKLQKNDYYGYAECYNDSSLRENSSWKDVVFKSILRSKRRLEETRIFDLKYAEQLLSKLQKYSDYLDRIRPKPFLDDITTKNVLIHEGKLTGIVDVDNICFGDRLFHVALTRMALLSQGSDTDYIDYMLDEYDLEPRKIEILNFYTTVCCLDFMSELGQRFNKDSVPEVDLERVKLYESIFLKYLNSDNVMKTDLMRYGESCVDFYNEKIISDIVRVVKQGKEATVICCRSHENMDSEYMAVKLYKEKKYRNFKRDKVYHIGRVWDQRLLRAIRKKTAVGQDAERSNWVSNEYDTLATLYDAGVNVPKPIAHTHDAIVMEFLGEQDLCSSLLKDTRLTKDEAKIVFTKLLDDIETMLEYGIVHGDLSAYNILYHEEEPYIIDFPQAVNPSVNQYAYDLLVRDIVNVCKYFKRYDIEANPDEIAKGFWKPRYGYC